MEFSSTAKQTLTEEQFLFLNQIQQEYVIGMQALNSLETTKTLTVYGGAMIERDSQTFHQVKEICIELGKNGWAIVTGGGPGVMTAALDGAKEGGSKAIAFGINIPGEPPAPNSDVYLSFTNFSVRKYLLRQSDAFIFAPGGVGTLDEMMELVTLMTTGKYPLKPIFLLDSKFWEGYLEWFAKILLNERNVIRPTVMNLFQLFDTPQDILSKLT
jgi:uncharacterized protein (TIGR00730 family)